MLYAQFDVNLPRDPRWLRLTMEARLYFQSMVMYAVEHGSGVLERAEWESTAAMRSCLGIKTGDAGKVLKELASAASHYIDLARRTITIHGFARRYAVMLDRRKRDAARKRVQRRRPRERASSSMSIEKRPQDVRGTSVDVHGSPGVDVDVDLDVKNVKVKTPPLTCSGCSTGTPPPAVTPPPATPNTKSTAGFGHSCPDGTAESKHGGNGAQRHTPKVTKPPTAPAATPPLPDLSPTLEPARGILEAWIAAEGYSKGPELRQLANWCDHRDSVILLAHVHEIAEADVAESRCALLWARIGPHTGPPVAPSDVAVAWAKAELAKAPSPTALVPECAKKGKAKREPSALGDVLRGDGRASP